MSPFSTLLFFYFPQRGSHVKAVDARACMQGGGSPTWAWHMPWPAIRLYYSSVSGWSTRGYTHRYAP